MKHLTKYILAIFFAFALSACEGGGDSDNEDNQAVQTGIFIDSPVAGITYKTATQSGVTDAQGKFNYLAGESVVFSIGGISFPSVIAKGTVTPLDLSGGDINDSVTINIARLLQTLDTDNDASNGITIDVSAVSSAITLDFQKSIADFAAEVTTKLSQTLVDQTTAITHLQSQLSTITSPTSPTSSWNTTDNGITLFDKAVGSYDVYIWQTTNSTIPIGDMTFNFAKAGNEGKVTSTTGNIDITTAEANGTGDIRGDLTDIFGEGFLYFANIYRFTFGLGHGSSAFTVEFSNNGLITGTYSDSNGEIKFSNSTTEKFSPTVPAELLSKVGTYQSNGYFFHSEPGSFSISSNGTVQYTDPSNCTVKSITWDGNGDRVTETGNIVIFDPATGQQISINLINVAAGFEYRIGGSNGSNIYRLDETQTTSSVANTLDGTYGLSACNARTVDNKPPVITLATNITVNTTDVNGIAKSFEMFQYLASASATDTLTATYSENIGVTHNAPAGNYPVGDTIVTFTAKDPQNNTATKTGIITVRFIDSINPVVTAPNNITLAATDALGTLASQSTVASWLASATATDNIDGSITAPAKNALTVFAIGDHTIIFEATDSSGNTATDTAILTIADLSKPVISLNGSANVTITQGATYTELGATAADNVAVSTAVVIDSSAINSLVVGTYTVTYNVTDNAGNAAIQVTRLVEVKAPQAFNLNLVNPSPTNQNINKITYGNEFVAVGDAGVILTSNDGATWVAQQSNVEGILKDICWDGSKYWVSEFGGGILSSTSGSTWTKLASNITSIYYLACSSNKLVALAGEAIYSSTDGITWSDENVISMKSIKFINNQFVAVGLNAQYKSSTGSGWSQTSSIQKLYDVSWDGNQYVLVGRQSSFPQRITYTSPDLVTYTLAPDPAISSNEIRFINNQYFALGFSGEIAKSSDFSTWTQFDNIAPVTASTIESIVYNNNASSPVYVMVGKLGVIYSSTDLTTWVAQKKVITNKDLHQVAWDNANKIAVAVGKEGTIVRSTDYINWSSVTSGVTTDLLAVHYGNQFIAVGASGVILTSPDGLTWTVQTSGTSRLLTGVAWDASQTTYVAVAINEALTSTDGISWTKNSTTFAVPIKIIWDGAQFVILTSAKTHTSTNGVSWVDKGTISGAGGTSTLVWNENNYYVTSLNGGALFSSNSLAGWTFTGNKVGAQNLSFGQLVTNGYPTHIIWDNVANRYVATLDTKPAGLTTSLKGGVLTSIDSITWTSRGATTETLYHTIKAGDKYLMVGKSGVILLANE